MSKKISRDRHGIPQHFTTAWQVTHYTKSCIERIVTTSVSSGRLLVRRILATLADILRRGRGVLVHVRKVEGPKARQHVRELIAKTIAGMDDFSVKDQVLARL